MGTTIRFLFFWINCTTKERVEIYVGFADEGGYRENDNVPQEEAEDRVRRYCEQYCAKDMVKAETMIQVLRLKNFLREADAP